MLVVDCCSVVVRIDIELCIRCQFVEWVVLVLMGFDMEDVDLNW